MLSESVMSANKLHIKKNMKNLLSAFRQHKVSNKNAADYSKLYNKEKMKIVRMNANYHIHSIYSNIYKAMALFNTTVIEIMLKLVDDSFGKVGIVFTNYIDFYIHKKDIHICHPLYAKINDYFSRTNFMFIDG